jgi:hypothetical protein
MKKVKPVESASPSSGKTPSKGSEQKALKDEIQRLTMVINPNEANIMRHTHCV